LTAKTNVFFFWIFPDTFSLKFYSWIVSISKTPSSYGLATDGSRVTVVFKICHVSIFSS